MNKRLTLKIKSKTNDLKIVKYIIEDLDYIKDKESRSCVFIIFIWISSWFCVFDIKMNSSKSYIYFSRIWIYEWMNEWLNV